MANNLDEFQTFGKQQQEATRAAAASLAKGFQSIAAEMLDYSQKSLETSSAQLERLLRAKSLDDAVRTQSEYVKSAHESFVAQAKKIGELYTSLAKEALKPVESVIATVQSASVPIRAKAVGPAE
jgi:phasin family protein